MSNVTIRALRVKNAPLHLEDYQDRIALPRLQQLSSFRPQDQTRSLCGDLLVLEALKAYGNPCSLQYAKTELGKPYLPDIPDFHFNVSHSGSWVLCATGCTPLGIDIQQERPVKPAVLQRVLSEEEKRFFDSLRNLKRQSAFFDLWCLKEAYCKATGMGLHIPFRSFSLTLCPPTISDPAYQVMRIPFPEAEYHVGLCIHGTTLPETSLELVDEIR